MLRIQRCRRASAVRGQDAVGVFRVHGLDTGAGIGQSFRDFVGRYPGFRMLDERFMQIRRAIGTTHTYPTPTQRPHDTTQPSRHPKGVASLRGTRDVGKASACRTAA